MLKLKPISYLVSCPTFHVRQVRHPSPSFHLQIMSEQRLCRHPNVIGEVITIVIRPAVLRQLLQLLSLGPLVVGSVVDRISHLGQSRSANVARGIMLAVEVVWPTQRTQ